MQVVIVASGGFPVTDVADGALAAPFTMVAYVNTNGIGLPITLVASGGFPMVVKP